MASPATGYNLGALSAASPAPSNGLYQQQHLGGAPSPATAFLQHGNGTPGAMHAHLAHSGASMAPQQSRPAMSQAGSAISSSLATSADAPNEARKMVRTLLDPEGQGRFSLARIAVEVQAVQTDANDAFTATSPHYDPSARLLDLLATLDELQSQLARTGLGALKLGQNDYNSSSVQGMAASMASDVQNSFRTRQRVRDGSGVARSVLK